MSCINALHEPGKLGLRPMQGLNRVPPEIFHYIFEPLRHDKKTLSSSSSVSRYWREVSLHWLFAHISIPSVQLFTGFLEFVHTHPHLGAHVRKLVFHHHFKLHLSVPEEELRTFLSSAISGLPSLRSLSLNDAKLAPDDDLPSSLPLVDRDSKPSSRHLQHLSILCSLDTSWWTSILIWFLSRYTVGTLKLVGVEIAIDDSIAVSPLNCLRNSVRISKLILDACDSWYHGVYPLLEAILQPDSVQEVSVSYGSSSDITHIHTLMGAVGHNVTYVSLDLANFISLNLPSELNWAALGECLTCCPQLESLHIKILADGDGGYSGLPCHALFTTILPHASRMLQKLTIELVGEAQWFVNTGDFEMWDLEALDVYLTRKPAEFPSLRSVGIELRMPLPDDNESLVELLLMRLPALERAGILRIFCDDMTPSFLAELEIEPLPTRED
ncbi:hypothetical protein V8D89_006312 [Ganoderma adspersum]